jgi:hypothetical protein
VFETEVARDAIERAALTGDDPIGQVRLAHEGARQRQEICIARSDHVVHHCGRPQAPDENHGDGNDLLQALSERPVIGLRNPRGEQPMHDAVR